MLCISSCASAQVSDLNKPTDYILQYLAASTTLWLGSDSWKDSIQYYKKIETQFKNENVKVNYIIFLTPEHAILDTKIEDTRTITAKNDEEFLKMLLTDNNRETIHDYSTECHVKTKINSSDKNSRTIAVTKTCKCKSYLIEKAFREKTNATS